jgi:hypothetical protein
LIAALLHGLAYLILLPPWMGEDEPWHVEYAHYIGRGHMPWGGQEISAEDLDLYSPSQLQVVREIGGISREEIVSTQAALVNSMREHHFWRKVDWAGNGDGAQNFDQVSPYLTATHQPPLYYLIVGQLLRFSGGGVLVEMWILRGCSLLAYLAVVLASYQLARQLSPDPWIPLVVGLIAAWWPMHARQAAVVNNDVLVKVFSAWSLVVSAKILMHGLTPRRFMAGALLAVLAVATKTTGAAALVPFACACMFHPGGNPAFRRKRQALGLFALLVGLAGVPLFYYLANNPAIPRTLQRTQERLAEMFGGDSIEEFGRTSVGAFNWYSRNLPGSIHEAVFWFLAAGSLGLGWILVRKQPQIQRPVLLLCLAGLGAQLALILLRGVSAGRYALPMLPAFALLLGAAYLGPWPARWRRPAGLVVLSVLLAFDGVFLWSGLVWNQYGVWGS